MNCIQIHSQILPFLSVSNHINKPRWNTEKLIWSSSNDRSQKITTRTRAIAESLVLGVSSRARPGDVSVLLQTGAVLLFMYGIANFAFPAFLSKYDEFDKVSEDTKAKDANPFDDDEAKIREEEAN